MKDLDLTNFKIPTLKRERVEVAALGVAVYIQELTALAKEEYDAGIWLSNENEESKSTQFRLRLVAACICDENGGPSLTYEQLAQMPQNAVIDVLYSVAQRINSAGEEGIEAEAKNL